MLTTSVNPVAFTIGSLTVRWYGIMIAMAFYCQYPRLVSRAFSRFPQSMRFYGAATSVTAQRDGIVGLVANDHQHTGRVVGLVDYLSTLIGGEVD